MARSKIKPAIPENHPIAQAVAPLRAAAVAITTARANEYLAEIKARIAAEPNIEALAPHPSLHNSEYAYARAYAWRRIIKQLSRTVPGQSLDFTGKTPELIEWNDAGAAEYLAEQIAHAEHNYTVYVIKLIAKVEQDGAVATTASVQGTNDAWTESTLTVQLQDGTTQDWRTKQIWNTSIYGKIFAQYPTRIVKAKK